MISCNSKLVLVEDDSSSSIREFHNNTEYSVVAVNGTRQSTYSFLVWSNLGLGVVPGQPSFFHKNKRKDQERSHRSKKKNERIERVLKNIGMICKGTEQNRTEQNGTEIAWKERLKSGTHSYYQECVLSRERILNQECVLIILK